MKEGELTPENIHEKGELPNFEFVSDKEAVLSQMEDLHKRYDMDFDPEEWWQQSQEMYLQTVSKFESEKNRLHQTLKITQDFLGLEPRINKIAIYPNIVSELKSHASGAVDEQTQHLVLTDREGYEGDARHEYTHALLNPLRTELHKRMNPATKKALIKSLLGRAKDHYLGKNFTPDDEELASGILEEYIVRGSDDYFRNIEKGGEAKALEEANEKLLLAGEMQVNSYRELLAMDKEWKLRVFSYEQITNYNQMIKAGKIKNFRDYLPILLTNLKKELERVT